VWTNKEVFVFCCVHVQTITNGRTSSTCVGADQPAVRKRDLDLDFAPTSGTAAAGTVKWTSRRAAIYLLPSVHSGPSGSMGTMRLAACAVLLSLEKETERRVEETK